MLIEMNRGIEVLKKVCIVVVSVLFLWFSRLILICIPGVFDVVAKAAVVSSNLKTCEICQLKEMIKKGELNKIKAKTKPAQKNAAVLNCENKPVVSNHGKIVRQCIVEVAKENTINLGDKAFVVNMTKHPNDEVVKVSKNSASFNLTKKLEPQVLILHTHTTESYLNEVKNEYDSKEVSRTKDQTKNVVKVGEEIVKQLETAGIKTVHDKTVHDEPYTGAYDRSKTTILNNLKKHPSIKVVLDVHRDSIRRDAKHERVAPIAKINGKNAAQMMLICGCDDGTMNFPTYFQNLAFACSIQRQIGKDYHSLARPMMFKYKDYNQKLTPGTLLVEVGSSENSLDEATYSATLFGKSLAKVLNKLKK